MARPRQKLDYSGDAKLVSKRLKNEPPGILRERLHAVKLGLEGELSLPQIAERIQRSRATIQTWFDSYRKGGIEGLCFQSEEKGGRRKVLTERQWNQFRAKLAKGSFRTGKQARDWIEKRFGVCRTTSTVRRWMGKLEARLKVVRPRHPRSCDKLRYQFRNQLARQLFKTLNSNLPEGWKKRPLRIWVADEARFGLQPCHRRAWVTKGVRAHKNSQCRYDWQYIWGALQVGGGGSEFFYSNKADGDMSAHFLSQISARDPYAVHAVIWDGAGFHPENPDPRIPDNVVVLRQPPYSPELNPVERLWDMLRDGLCNRSWKNLDDLLEAATKWLKSFWERPEKILSLVGSGWMRHQANGC